MNSAAFSRSMRVGVALAVLTGALAACSSPAEKAEKYYARGMELLGKGDVDRARVELQNALQINANHGNALYGLALIAERQGQWDRVVGLLNRVIELDPKNMKAQIRLGRLLLAAGELDRALKISDLTLEAEPDNAEVLALRAAVLYRLDDRAGAIAQANAALSRDPKSAEALAVLATERISAGDPARAVVYLDRGIALDERSVVLQIIKVQALERMKNIDGAEQVFRKLIALYPETIGYRQVLARFLDGHGRAADAEREYRAIADTEPKNVPARMDLVRFVWRKRGAGAAAEELKAAVAKYADISDLKFALSSFHLSQGDRKAAEEVLRGIIARHGDNTDGIRAKGELAGLLLGAQDRKGATALIDEVLAKDQRNEQGLILKASIALDDRNYDQAIGHLRAILKDAPDSARALNLLGRAHELSGAHELAQEQYQRAFQVSRGAAQYGIGFIEFLLRRGQPARAETVAEAVLRAQPNHVQALRLLAQARINKRDWAGAQAVADTLRKLGGGAQAEQVRGAVLAARGDLAGSTAAFRRAYEASPGELRPMLTVVRSYLAAGKTGEALTFLGSAIKAAPSRVEPRVLQGEVYAMTGDYASAERAFRGAIDLDPTNAAPYAELVKTYVRTKRQDEADRTLAQGLEKAKSKFALRMQQAELHEMRGRVDDAIKVYEQILKEQPRADVAANNLASLLAEHRRDKATLERANALAQRFRRSEIPQFRDTLGWVQYRLDKPDDALPLIAGAVKQLPDEPVFRYHLGMVHLAKNNKPAAKRELEAALKLAKGKALPEAEEIRKTLQSL